MGARAGGTSQPFGGASPSRSQFGSSNFNAGSNPSMGSTFQQPTMSNQAFPSATNAGAFSRPSNMQQNMFTRPQSAAPAAGGLGCTTDPAKATELANQLIGMLFRSSQMMSDIVNMFNAPNTRPTGTGSRPNAFGSPTTTFNPRPSRFPMNPMSSMATGQGMMGASPANTRPQAMGAVNAPYAR